MRRILLRSLRRAAEQRFAQTVAGNSVRQSLRGGPVRRLMSTFRANPLEWGAALLLINTLLGLAFTCVNGTCWKVSINLPWNFAVFAEWNAADLLSILSALWSVQVMIAALVYPIVISFIAVLLQQRVGTGRRIDAYLDATSAVPASVSCLTLVGGVTLQYVVLLYLPNFANHMPGWVVIDFVWLGLNVVATINFTIRSIAFLRPNEQRTAIRQHLVVNVWPRETHMQIANRELEGNSAAYLCGNAGRVFSFNVTSQDSSHKVERDLGGGQWLFDVYLRPLRWAIRLMIWRRTRYLRRLGKPSNPRRDQITLPVISSSLSLSVHHKYTGTVVLVNAEEHWSIGPLSELLIRMSFAFRRQEPVPQKVVEYVQDSITEACEAASGVSSARFDEAMKDLVEIHATVLAIGETDPNAGVANWNMVGSWREFGTPADRNFTENYFDLFDSAVNAIDSNPYAFGKCARLAVELLLSTRELSVQARMPILGLPSSLNRTLGRWWMQAAETAQSQTYSACESITLSGSDGVRYSEAIREFVTAWEFIVRQGKICFARDKPVTWNDFCRLSGYYIEHLNETVSMLVSAIYRGDEVSVEWMGSVEQGWMWNVESQADMIAQLEPLSQWVTTSVFWMPWETVKQAYGSVSPKDLFVIALRNYWLDCRSIVVYLCLNAAVSCNKPTSFAGKTAAKILHGRHTKGSGIGVETAAPLGDSFSDAFIQILRQTIITSGDGPHYNPGLAAVIQKVQRESSAPLVPGRLHVTSGIHDLSSLRGSQSLYLALACRNSAQSSDRATRFVRELIRGDIRNLQQIEALIDELLAQLSEPIATNRQHAFDSACGTSTKIATAEVRKSLVQSLDEAKECYREVVNSLPLDQARLDSLASEISTYLANTPALVGPASIFGSILITEAVGPEKRCVIGQEVPKIEFTNPPYSLDMYSNPGNLIPKLMEDIGYAAVLSVLQSGHVVRRNASDPQRYFAEMLVAAEALQKVGLTPIVIVDLVSLPDWFALLSTPEHPETQRILKGTSGRVSMEGDRGHGYRCHIDGIPIYQVFLGGTGSSFVVARENFQHLHLGHLPDTSAVRAAWEPRPSDSTLGSLSLSFALITPRVQGRVTQLVHAGISDTSHGPTETPR